MSSNWRRIEVLPLSLLGAVIPIVLGCQQPTQEDFGSPLTPVSNVATNTQPVPTSPTALYATPPAPTHLATIESDPPDILTLRQNLKSRRLKAGEAPVIPPESVLKSPFDLSGDWTTGGGFDGWSLRLARREGGDFDVKLSFWDCTSRHQSEGVGRYHNGLLTLDLSAMSHPAMEYGEVKTLHALRVGGFPMLAPPSVAESLIEFETMCEAARVDMKDHLVIRPHYSFIRADDYK